MSDAIHQEFQEICREAFAAFDIVRTGFLTGEIINLNGGAFMAP